jgi:putative phosphonate metabolism protein
MSFARYGVYFTPDNKALAQAGATWLGWDIARGEAIEAPDLTITKRPRKYGFHGTIKPPFALADGANEDALIKDFKTFCSTARPIMLQGLILARIGGFIALVPTGDFSELANLAGNAVSKLDHFRAPPAEQELARRRQAKLTPEQDINLKTWGYPYVFNDFRFHMTLTSPLKRDQFDAVMTRAHAHFAPCLPTPFVIKSLTLVGEREDGMFQEILRCPLG